MKISNIKEITIKELKSQFDHLSGYILIAIFLGLLYFFFLKTFFVNGVVSMRSMFQLLPWFLAIFVPAVTMGSFASEVEKQTFEYIETKPISQMDLVLGKILGATKIAYIAILLTLPLPIVISRIAPLDLGETLAGYIGALILTFSLASLGVAVSTFYKNQIAAFITSAVLILLLIIINSSLTAINLPTGIVNALAQFSIVDNYQPFARGVINLDNIVYFVIFIVTSIAIAYTNVEKIRISNTTALYKRTFTAIIGVALVGIALVYLAGIIGEQVGRIDLTSSKRYTLSPVTTELVKKEGKIIIEVYASDNLPPQYQSVYSEVKNVLSDYKSVAGGNLEVKYLDPKANGERLSTLDIQPVQFNTVGEDQFQIQQGYLALVILTADEAKKEKIDYINSVDDLEYQISSIISKLKSASKPKVGFVTGNGEKTIFEDYALLQQLLQTEYDIQSAPLRSVSPATPTDTSKTPLADPNLKQYNLVVIAGPRNNYDAESLKFIDDYIQSGGNVLYLGDTEDIDINTGLVTPLPETGQILSKYGATINTDMAYDIKNGMEIPVSNTLTAKYPFFIIGVKDDASNDIQFLPQNVLLPWSSTLELDSNWKWIYATTDNGGTQTGTINLDPKNKPSTDGLKRLPIIAYRKTDNGGTLVIVGSSRLFVNQFASAVQENAVLALALFENMAKGGGLSQIKAKNLIGSQFTVVENSVKSSINYGAPIASIIILALIGTSRIYRKKKLAKIYA